MIFSRTAPQVKLSRPMPDLQDYMTTEDAAKKLSFNVVHLRAMIREKKLDGLKIGRTWLVSRKAVDDYLKKTAGLNKHDPRRKQK